MSIAEFLESRRLSEAGLGGIRSTMKALASLNQAHLAVKGVTSGKLVREVIRKNLDESDEREARKIILRTVDEMISDLQKLRKEADKKLGKPRHKTPRVESRLSEAGFSGDFSVGSNVKTGSAKQSWNIDFGKIKKGSKLRFLSGTQPQFFTVEKIQKKGNEIQLIGKMGKSGKGKGRATMHLYPNGKYGAFVDIMPVRRSASPRRIDFKQKTLQHA